MSHLVCAELSQSLCTQSHKLSLFLLGKEFRADVANVLTRLGVHTLVYREIKNIPFFTGDYNGVHFVAYCVHTSSDVTAEDVRRIVGAKQKTGTTKGLLIANQDTIPTDCLLDLNKGGCEFVPVSYYGDKGWGNKMADKFDEFFPIVDTSDDGVSYCIFIGHSAGIACDIYSSSHCREKSCQL